MSYTYDWPMASPTSAIAIYNVSDKRGKLGVDLLITNRDESVGTGWSLSAGGFDEPKEMFNEVGKVVEGIAETYREILEELGAGFEKIIPYDDFKKRVEYLWDCSRTAEKGIVHKTVFRSLEVSASELRRIKRLPPTSERKGMKVARLELAGDNYFSTGFDAVKKALKGFRYDIEVDATQMLWEKLERKHRGEPAGYSGW